ncbi:MAG: hypothetical protein WBQ69_07900 [Gallionella sp.]
MNKRQKFALWAGAGNLVIFLLFPPVDSFSFADIKAPVFAGFHPAWTFGVNEAVNENMLFLEMVVLLVNVAIAWLLLRDQTTPARAKRHFDYQNAILLTVAANLTIILLFPPFEYAYAMTRAILPSFQGFYFVFQAGPMLSIVTPLLYLEVVFVLFNGAILWLLFKREEVQVFSPQKIN